VLYHDKECGYDKDVIIYDRSIFKNFEYAVMGEHDALQIINFSSITVKLKGAFLCLCMFHNFHFYCQSR